MRNYWTEARLKPIRPKSKSSSCMSDCPSSCAVGLIRPLCAALPGTHLPLWHLEHHDHGLQPRLHSYGFKPISKGLPHPTETQHGQACHLIPSSLAPTDILVIFPLLRQNTTIKAAIKEILSYRAYCWRALVFMTIIVKRMGADRQAGCSRNNRGLTT